jgi:hypothetical protein
LLRKAAERAVEGLWKAIGGLIDTFTPPECANYFAGGRVRPDVIGSALTFDPGRSRVGDSIPIG